MHPTYSHLSITDLNSLKYWSNSLYSISDISNVENPGVSAIYVFLLISYSFVDVVVFFPFLFLTLISPSCVTSSLNIAFINVDFPTPEFPENTFIFPYNTSFKFCIPSCSFAIVSITLYPTFS